MALWMGNLVSASITTTRSWPAAMGGNVVTAPSDLALFPAAAVMMVTPVPAPVTTPSLALTVADPPLALQVKPVKGSARPAESLASALSASVLPASTGAVITSQLATDATVGAATQVPPEQICPLLQSELLPQPGATQVPSSQTWPELQSAAVKQLCALSAPAGVAPAAMSPQQKAAASAQRKGDRLIEFLRGRVVVLFVFIFVGGLLTVLTSIQFRTEPGTILTRRF